MATSDILGPYNADLSGASTAGAIAADMMSAGFTQSTSMTCYVHEGSLYIVYSTGA